MKHFILVVLTFIVFTPRAHALFGHVAIERDRRVETEHQLVSAQQQFVVQQKITGRWQALSFVLGVGVVASLVTGAAIGSRGRKHAIRN